MSKTNKVFSVPIFGNAGQTSDGSYHSRRNLSLIQTPYGRLVAFDDYSNDKKSSIIPGIYVCDLPPTKRGLMRMRVNPVSDEMKENIVKILKEGGYAEPFNFWQ